MAAIGFLSMNDLPSRSGERPQTSRAMPQQQSSQTAPIGLQEELFERAIALPGVSTGPSGVSVPGARAFMLDEGAATGPDDALFMVGREFAHVHPPYDGSLPLILPVEVAKLAIDKGWGEPHPMAQLIGGGSSTALMVYGPRDESEVETVWQILQASYAFAAGQ